MIVRVSVDDLRSAFRKATLGLPDQWGSFYRRLKERTRRAVFFDEDRVRDVVCPQCSKPFRLCWNDYTTVDPDLQFETRDSGRPTHHPETLRISDCPSGGVYNVAVHCPHCNYEEEL